MIVKIMNYSETIASISIPASDGLGRVELACGFDDFKDCVSDNSSLKF